MQRCDIAALPRGRGWNGSTPLAMHLTKPVRVATPLQMSNRRAEGKEPPQFLS